MLLKNEFSFLKKSKIKAGEGKKDGAYPFFTSSDSKLLYLDEYIFDDEAIIVGTGGMPSCNYYNGKFAVSTDNYVLVPIGKTKAKTLYYFLRNNNLEILARGFHGAGLKHIGKDYLENIQLPVITAAIQDKLIKELDSIVLFIKSLDKQLEKLDELIKSRFIEMFLSKNVIGNYARKKWSDVVTIYNGKDYKSYLSDKENGYPVFGSGGFMGVYADKYICEGTLTIIGRKGTIDKPLLVIGKIWNIDTAFAIKTNSAELNPVYFHYRSKFYDYLEMNKQTTKPSLRKSD